MPQEGKLAETAPNRPLALTIGAAAVTLVVVIGILTGPSVIDCFGGPDNAGMCLRDKLAGAGLAPPAATAPEAGEATAEAEAATPEAEAVPSEIAVPEDLIAATFGLLRAEPDGSVVIAGSGTPGSEVEVYADEELIGRATVEESGDWVLVPEEPIAPGGREITLAEAGKEGRADQSFVVVIDPDRDSQPLVVASELGEASEVLQGLEQPAPMEVASVPDEATTAPELPGETAQTPAVPTEQSTDDGDAAVISDAPRAPASEASPEADTEQAASEATQAPASDPELAPAPVEAAAEPETAVAEPEADEPVDESASAPASEPSAPAAETEAEVAAATAEPAIPTAESPASVTSEPVEVAIPPTIDAIEIDGERTFFAGAGPDGATMRLYVDDVFIADALVDGSRWLVEAGNILPGPQHAVRIDMLVANSAEVAARAEVNFRVDVPAGSTAVAEASATAQQPDVVSEAVETPAEPAVAQSEPQAGTTAEPVPAPTETAAAAEPAVPAPEPAVDVAEATGADAVPTMVAEPVGDPELQRFASGRAIIRRGDNLWTIARRVYGQGIKYTTIYEANTAQIRDPDWIYPGQVFDLPKAE